MRDRHLQCIIRNRPCCNLPYIVSRYERLICSHTDTLYNEDDKTVHGPTYIKSSAAYSICYSFSNFLKLSHDFILFGNLVNDVVVNNILSEVHTSATFIFIVTVNVAGRVHNLVVVVAFFPKFCNLIGWHFIPNVSDSGKKASRRNASLNVGGQEKITANIRTPIGFPLQD